MRLALTFLSCLLYSILFSQVEYPDNSFGDHGIVITPFVYGGALYAITMQKDLKIIAAGQDGHYLAIARYNPDGTLDASFGSDGAVQILVPGLVPSPHAVAVQKDGKIVAAGTAYGQGSAAFVARFLPDGTPDPSFGTYGLLTPTTVTDAISGLVIQDDQKILLCGQSLVSSSAPPSFSMFRLNPDGTFDDSFGVNGVVVTNFKQNTSSGAVAIKLQFGNKILLAGDAGSNGGDIALARYKLDGSLDSSFGKHGKIMQDFGASEGVADAAIDSNNRIIVGGTQSLNLLFGTENFLICRFKPDGKLDSSFGESGKQITDLYGNTDDDNALALDKSGNIIACGITRNNSAGDILAAVAYKSNGKIDSSFWPTPVLTIDTALVSSGNAVYIQPDGKILLGGLINTTDGGGGFLLLRYAKSEILAAAILHFTIQGVGDNVQVKWQSENDISTEMFYVQRSFDGVHFSIIDTVSAKSNSSASENYSYTDVEVALLKQNKLYYRLEKVGEDGKSNYSAIQMISLTNNSMFSISPNPAKSYINITSTVAVANAQVTITGSNGRTLYSMKHSFNTGDQLRISLAQISKQTLFVSVATNTGTQKLKVLKE